MLANSSVPAPIIKWAGGKRQLLPIIESMMPQTFGTYFEPFFGGGALFFAVQPKKAVINDFNDQLVNMYQQVRDNKAKVVDLLNRWQNEYNSFALQDDRDQYYYDRRKEYNQLLVDGVHSPKEAALLIFLNKSGFNGVYRVNKSGLYNVPSAHRASLKLYDKDNMNAVSKALAHATIYVGDFEKACVDAKAGDFVFFDSPYYDTFDTYQAGGFSVDDHKRLFDLFQSLTDKGVYCLLTNNDCDYIKDLYKWFNIKEVDVKRMVNRDASHRTGKEVVITNYAGKEAVV